MGKRTEYHREYKRKQRAEALKDRLCGVCCKNEPREGLATCDDCLAKIDAARKAKRGPASADPLCVVSRPE